MEDVIYDDKRERALQVLQDKEVNTEIKVMFGDWVVNGDNDVININSKTAYCSLYSNRTNLSTQKEVLSHLEEKVWCIGEQRENLLKALDFIGLP